MKYKKQNKIKIFLGNTARSFENISVISKTVLIIGQTFILCALLAFLLYIIHVRNSQNTEIFAYTFKMSKIFLDNAIAGLAVLWGGALFIDYVEKSHSL